MIWFKFKRCILGCVENILEKDKFGGYCNYLDGDEVFGLGVVEIKVLKID